MEELKGIFLSLEHNNLGIASILGIIDFEDIPFSKR
jgi:hypothetical protein